MHRDGLRVWNRRIRTLWHIGHHKWRGHVFLRIHRFRLCGHHGRRGQISATIYPHSDCRVSVDRLLGVLWRLDGTHHRVTVLRAKSRSTIPTFVQNVRMGLGQMARVDWSNLRTMLQVILPFVT